jgi:purine-binding chemotaxis protein CheW
MIVNIALPLLDTMVIACHPVQHERKTMQATVPTTTSDSTATLQYLVFRLGGLEYALDFRKVQELRPLKALERFASDGEIISGVAVSRGVIMPIVDMRIAFGPRPPQHDPNTDCIILKLSSCVMGMVVDGVTDIVALAPGQIRPIPGAAQQVDYLMGLGDIEGRRLIVVDIDKLMSIRKVPCGARQAA